MHPDNRHVFHCLDAGSRTLPTKCFHNLIQPVQIGTADDNRDVRHSRSIRTFADELYVDTSIAENTDRNPSTAGRILHANKTYKTQVGRFNYSADSR